MKIKNILIHFYAAVTIMVFCCSFSVVSDEELIASGASEDVLEMLKLDLLQGQTGTVTFPECHAHINVPDELQFLDKEQGKKLLVQYWSNSEDKMDKLLGVMVPRSAQCFYQVTVAYVIEYDNCGYIKDDDAKSIDYDELLDQLRKSFEEESKALPQDEKITLRGWAVPPKYIQESHVLVWAKSISFGTNEVVNYDMRVLGKDGLVSINAVSSPDNLEEIDSKGNDIINTFSYDKGYMYAEFDPKRDRVSDWTIGGLIAGGILAKSGLLAKLGILLLKFWKLLIVGIVALGAGVAKLFGRKKNK